VSELHTALSVAYRHADESTTTEQEREAILAAIAVTFDTKEAEIAAQTLHHMREARRHQMMLKSILTGSGGRKP
jgi:hypothetical protein